MITMSQNQDDLTTKFQQLENPKKVPQIPSKIQRVPHYLRKPNQENNVDKYYTPMVVSFGPIHHRNKNLKLGEQYKFLWAHMFLKRTEQDKEILYEKVKSNLNHIKELYADDVKEEVLASFDDETLSLMLFVDGCALLQILEIGRVEKAEEMEVKNDQLDFVCQDMLLLENQLPYFLLKILSDYDDNKLFRIMGQYFVRNHPEEIFIPQQNNSSQQSEDTGQGEHILEINVDAIAQAPPSNLLHQLRIIILKADKINGYDSISSHSSFLPKEKAGKKEKYEAVTHRNITELIKAGIKPERNEKARWKVRFEGGSIRARLYLPVMVLDDMTARTTMNLMAFEMCPDYKNGYEIWSLMAFLNSLIDHIDDVVELRSAGVLRNTLGSDEEVASIFNTITNTELVPKTYLYSQVTREIEMHYTNTWKTWMAKGYSMYFSTPWSIGAFLAAILGIALTIMQTYFSAKQGLSPSPSPPPHPPSRL